MTRDIWVLQPRLEQRAGKRAYRLLTHPKFRAGYDFLLLRAESGEPLGELAEWWTQFQFASESEQQSLVSNLAASPSPKKKRRRRKKPKIAKSADVKSSQ
jgi:poly(A) polymerase